MIGLDRSIHSPLPDERTGAMTRQNEIPDPAELGKPGLTDRKGRRATALRRAGSKVIAGKAAHEILARMHVIDEARQRCEHDSLSTVFRSLEGLMISPKRTLPGVAALGIAIGLLVPAAPASATSYDYCWTVIRTSPIYSTAGGTTQVGTAHTGDTFQNIQSIVKGSWRYGDDEQNGAYGWINDGNLTHGYPCE